MGSFKIKEFQSNFIQCFYYSGLLWLCKQLLARNGKFVIMFHGVSNTKSPEIPKDAQPYLDAVEFESILLWLKKSFSFLTPDEFLASEKSGLLLTFDDGFYNNFSNVLPILERYQTPGLFFITTQHIKYPERWLHFIQSKLNSYGIDKDSISDEIQMDYYNGISEQNLYDMANNPLVTIGSHSVTHPLFSQCSADEIEKELIDSKVYLESVIVKSVDYFAYPSGDYNQIVLDYVKLSGYSAAFGIDRINHIGNPLFEIPRIGIYSNAKPYLAAKLSGLYQKLI